ncbi:MAG: histone deacetylase [Acidobacteria bacterium]|nr:histone deacetylase [Acidobacteriota bacterium]
MSTAKRLFYCDHHRIPLPEGHRFPAEKYRLLRERLYGPSFHFLPAPEADPAVIARVHDPAYVAAFIDGTLDAAAVRRIGFPWSAGLVHRTLASVGSTLAATDEAWETGWGGTLAGGTHHAFRDHGSGYCVFNDFAVAVAWLRDTGRLHLQDRAAIVDLDVHQGDGTAAMFATDEAVLTVSLHGANNFPFRKQESRIDVALPDGAGDAQCLAALAEVLPRVEAFAPRLVFYQSGVDALAEDKLGRLNLTLPGLQQRDRMLFETINRLGVPVVVTLGGGYADPIMRTVEAHSQTFLTALAAFEPTQAAAGRLGPPATP